MKDNEVNEIEVKPFSSRNFSVELHKRLKMYALDRNISVETAHNEIVELGLDVAELQAKQRNG